MKINVVAKGHRPARATRTSIAANFGILAVVLSMLCLASSAALASGVTIKVGDIIVVDGNAGPPAGKGALIHIDPVTGVQTLISSANNLEESTGVAVLPSGYIVVADRGAGSVPGKVIRVNPADGTQTVLSTFPTTADPFAIAVDPNSGVIYVTDSGFDLSRGINVSGRILRIDPATGNQYLIAQATSSCTIPSGGGACQTPGAPGDYLAHPYGIAVDAGGQIVVTDMSAFNGQGAIIRVNPATGAETLLWGPASANPAPLVVQNAPAGCPMGITVEQTGALLVTAFSYPAPPNTVYGCVPPGIFRVDLANHSQTTVSANPPVGWSLPFGVDTEDNGNILVVDEGLAMVFRLDPTGQFIAPIPLSSGGMLVVPSSLTVVKFLPPNGPPKSSDTAPVISTLGASPNSVNEGSSTTLNGTFTDPDVGETHSVTINWGDGSAGTVINLGAGTLSFSQAHQYLDNPSGAPSGAFAISVIVSDGSLTATGGASITVSNAAPAVTGITGPASVALGLGATIAASFTDAGALDTHTCVFSWNDGTTNPGSIVETNGSGSCTSSHTYASTGTYIGNITVTDKDGDSSSSNFQIAVGPSGPPPPQGGTINIGDILVVDGNAGPPPGKGAVVRINPVTGDQTLISSGNVLEESTGIVVLRNGQIVIVDRGFGSSIPGKVVQVNPADGIQTVVSTFPTTADPFAIAVDPTSDTIYVTDSGFNPERNLNVGGRILRVDPATGNQYLIAQGSSCTIPSGGGACQTPGAPGQYLTHPYGIAVDRNGQIVVTDMSAFNGQGAIIRVNPATGAQTLLWGPASANPAPIVIQNAPAGCPMGITVEQTGSLLVTAFSYPAPPFGTPVYGCVAPGIFRVDLVNRTQATVSANPPVGWSIPFGLDTEANGNILVLDEALSGVFRLDSIGQFIAPIPLSIHGLLVSPTGIVVVRNHAPAVAALSVAPTTINENGITTLNGTFTDPDAADGHTISINWSDGSANSVINLAPGAFTFSQSHQYLNNTSSGIDTITVTVTDSTGLSSAVSTTVRVNNVAPVIAGVVGSSSLAVGSAATLRANFTDVGTLDTHTCLFAWNDGSTSSGSVTEASGSGSCTAAHTYASAGSYSVTLAVSDNDGGSVNSSFQIVIHATPSPGVTLQVGDIVVVDPNAGPPSGGGAITYINPATGEQKPISSGDSLSESVGIAMESNGYILVADRITGVIRVNPGTGAQTIVSSGGMFADPFGIAVDSNSGNIFVADSGFDPSRNVNVTGKIIRVDSATGRQYLVAQGQYLVHPYGIAVDANGNLIVADMSSFDGQGAIVRVDPATGAQTLLWGPSSANPVVSQLAPMGCPMGVTVEGSGSILATEFRYPDTNPVYGCNPPGIFRVDLVNRTQTTVSANPPVGWRLPLGIDTEDNGNILVADFGWSAIYRLDPAGQFIAPIPLSSGGLLFQPFGLAVVKFLPPLGAPKASNTAAVIASLSVDSTTLNEGGSTTLNGAISDPDAGETHTVTVAWGDGSANTVINLATGTLSFSQSHQYNDNKTTPYAISVAVSDLGFTATGSTAVTVNNVAPAVTINGAPVSSSVGTAITLTSAVSDPSSTDTAAGFTYAWTATKNGSTAVASGSGTSLTFTPNDAGTYVVTLSVTDKDSGAGTASKTINVIYPAPTVAINGAPVSSAEGTAITLTSTVSGYGTLTYAWTVIKNGDTANPFASGSAAGLTFTPDDNGTYVVTLNVTGTGGTGADSKTINVYNVPPAAAVACTGECTPEGTRITLGASAVDPSAADTRAGFTFTWNIYKGSSTSTTPYASGTGNPSFVPNDNGPYVATVIARDKDGGTSTASINLNVTNVPPVITGVTGPSVPLAAPASTAITANFTDVGILDTHTCTFNWDDQTTSSGTVTETAGSGSCTKTHSFSEAGVYTVLVTVTDKDGGAATSFFKFVVVYDTSNGFVTGNGEISSPAGAYPGNPTGPVKFGFEAKYAHNATIPTGSTKIQFKKAKFKFTSTSYDWLVVSGNLAQYKGSGTLKMHVGNHNGDDDCDDDNHYQAVTAAYAFLLTVQDNTPNGVDKFRIKITNKATGAVFYDNAPGASDDINTATPQAISNGKVSIKGN